MHLLLANFESGEKIINWNFRETARSEHFEWSIFENLISNILSENDIK